MHFYVYVLRALINQPSVSTQENLEESLRELAVRKSEALDVAEMQNITLKEKLLAEIACYEVSSVTCMSTCRVNRKGVQCPI